jgi:hypothetical protein
MLPNCIEGDLCDYFVKEELKGISLTSPYSAGLMDTFPTICAVSSKGPNGPTPMEKYEAGLIEEFGSSTLPAFLAKGSKVFLEVKLDGNTRLDEKKEEEFAKVIAKGYRIFIIAPKILMKKREIKLEKIDCCELLGKGKSALCEIKAVKSAISSK